jgi:hypothetical protein
MAAVQNPGDGVGGGAGSAMRQWGCRRSVDCCRR